MNRLLAVVVSFGLVVAGQVVADEHEGGEEKEGSGISPVETFACSYKEGKGWDDLKGAIDGWNKWADGQGVEDYAAWVLQPYYSGPEQDFDVFWLGGSPTAKSLGATQDLWLATGSEAMKGFNDAIDCSGHGNFAVWQVKAPPKRENPGKIVISFSDCQMGDGMSWSDAAPALAEWGKYRESHGSTSGMWVFFPAYGGGGEEFDFKFVSAWQNLEDQGVDYDQYGAEGWRKAGEIFAGKFECDSSRVYLAMRVREATASSD